MKSRTSEFFTILATALISGGLAIVLMLGTTNGAFAALVNDISTQLGLTTGSTTAVEPVSSYSTTGSGSTSSSSSGTTTASATISSVTANWAGYVASGNSYTGITAGWTVPSVSASAAAQSADATWIGIGGSSSTDLIQIGTENIVVNGQDQLVAFYEELPDYAQTITSVSLSPGDTVTASVNETATDVWTLTLRDTTNGQSFTTTVDYDSSHSSAEWIQEAPSTTSGIMALDEFGSVSFTGGTVTADGSTESIKASGASAITMANSAGEQLTTVSALSSGGDGFSVTRTDASSSSSTSGTGTRRREPGINRFGNGRY